MTARMVLGGLRSDLIHAGAVEVQMLFDPANGFFQSLVERYARLPSQELAGDAEVGVETLDFALVGPNPIRCRLDPLGPADDGDDLLREIADADLVVGPEIDLPSQSFIRSGGTDEAIDRVGDEGEVASRRERAEA